MPESGLPSMSGQRRVTIVCEAFSNRASGGRAALALAKGLKESGALLQILVTNRLTPKEEDVWQEFGVEYAVSSDKIQESMWTAARSPVLPAVLRQCVFAAAKAYRLARLAFGRKRFRSCLAGFQPDAVHFASFLTDKPAYMIEEAKRSNAKVFLQPWIHQYACAQGFGFLRGSRCTACFSGDFSHAKSQGCLSATRALIEGHIRKSLKVATEGCIFLSSCSSTDNMLRLYGVPEESIVRLPLQFAPAGLVNHPRGVDKGFFLYHGQIKDFKGIQVLADCIRALPSVNFLICPPGSQGSQLRHWGLLEENFPNLRIKPNVFFGHGLEECLAEARAVVIPSLWDTTPEYSLLESLYLGKPTVVFDVGAHRDYLSDGIDSMVAPAGDTEGFIARVRRLHDDGELRHKIGRNARLTYETTWGSNPWRSALQAAYQTGGCELTQSNRAGGKNE